MGGMVRCAAFGNGSCLLDTRREADYENVDVVKGTCLADDTLGLPPDPTTPDILTNSPDGDESFGTGFLQYLWDKKNKGHQ